MQDRIRELREHDFEPLSYSSSSVEAFLREQARLLLTFCPSAINLRTLEAELSFCRMAADKARLFAHAFRSFSSSRRLGDLIHGVVQNRFRERFVSGGTKDFIGERWRWRRGRPDQASFGRTCRAVAPRQGWITVRRLAREAIDAREDAFYSTLHESLSSRDLVSYTELRADLISRDSAQIWELKAVRSAVEGVWQLARYRLGFNQLASFRRNCVAPGPAGLRCGDALFDLLLPAFVPEHVVFFLETSFVPGVILYVPIRVDDLESIGTAFLSAIWSAIQALSVFRRPDRDDDESEDDEDSDDEQQDDEPQDDEEQSEQDDLEDEGRHEGGETTEWASVQSSVEQTLGRLSDWEDRVRRAASRLGTYTPAEGAPTPALLLALVIVVTYVIVTSLSRSMGGVLMGPMLDQQRPMAATTPDLDRAIRALFREYSVSVVADARGITIACTDSEGVLSDAQTVISGGVVLRGCAPETAAPLVCAAFSASAACLKRVASHFAGTATA
jgi:hypothetical protein